MFRLTAALILLASSASAACDYGEETFLSCVIGKNGKSLTVCVAGNQVHYRFGRAYGKAELELSHWGRDIHYRPWNGIGRSVHEEVEFVNGAYRYVVYGGLDRLAGQDPNYSGPAQYGGVTVFKGSKQLTELECAPASVEFSWTQAIYSAKQAAGLDYNRDSDRWTPGGY